MTLRFNFAERDIDTICEKVNAYICNKAELHQIESYLLRTFTFAPIDIRETLGDRLKEIPALAQLEEDSNFITRLFFKAPDIFTTMWAKNCDYDAALKLVDKGQEANLKDALTNVIATSLNLVHPSAQ